MLACGMIFFLSEPFKGVSSTFIKQEWWGKEIMCLQKLRHDMVVWLSLVLWL